jgi:Zn-dependent protease
VRTCPGCGTGVSPSRLSCPACHQLLHREELEALSREAARAREAGDVGSEITAWRRALELLPPESGQSTTLSGRVGELSRRLEKGAVPGSPGTGREGRTGGRWRWAGLGAVGVLAWKLKAVVALVLTKGKLLLLGLTKSGTSLSMILAFGVYWTAFGWKFAAGLVVSVYIHEIGHVSALRQLGIQASAPMFIPGVGALVRLKQYPVDAREDARVGLAGPLWGLAAAVAAALVHLATDAAIWGAIAHLGAWINLFNLLPVWQLDGGRGFRALSRPQRWAVTATMGVAWYLSGEGLLVLVGLAAALRAWGGDAPESGDRRAFVEFLVLVAALSTLCAIPVTLP